MATLRQIQSPGVQINEIDLSQTATVPNGTNIFVTGFAAQGPSSEIINLTTNSDFLNIFGAPTNAAERYFYYTVNQLFTGGTNAQVSVARLPYGPDLGDGYNSDKYSALVFPVLPVSAGDTPSHAAGSSSIIALSSAQTYYFAQPTLVDLSLADYNNIKQGTINWSAFGGGNGLSYNPITGYSSLSANSIGMIVLNEAKTTINEKFEGLYLSLADNRNINPSTPYTAVLSAVSITQDNQYNTTYQQIPNSRLTFALSANATDNFSSLSRDIENIPQYTITLASSAYNDMAVLSLFKVRTTPFAPNPLQLSYSLVEGYATSFYANRTIQDINGGAPQNDFIQNVIDSKSSNLTVLVNPNISNNVAWLDANGNATKSIRVLGAGDVTNTTIAGGFREADVLYPLGVYSQSLDTTNVKLIGNGAAKLANVLDTASNADLYDIDVVIDGGVSTVIAVAALSSLSAATFDDTAYNADIDNALIALTNTQGTYQPGSTNVDPVGTWQAITQQFVQFTTNVRKDCIFISDPLRHIFVQGANFKTLNDKTLNFSNNIYWPLRNSYQGYNTSYAATYGNWASVLDQFSSQNVWIPFSGFAAAVYTNNDAIAYPWGAPAGFNRGAVTGLIDIAINPQQKQRDLLYKISVNPVVNFPNEGFTIYGQKTLLKTPSAFDRVNVRRLFLFLEKSVLNTSKLFVFEPNTTFTQNRLVNTIKPVFDLAKNTQGLYDYLIVCNATNNTPDVVDDNSLVVDIYIKPVRTAEFILVNFYATKTSQNFQELLQ